MALIKSVCIRHSLHCFSYLGPIKGGPSWTLIHNFASAPSASTAVITDARPIGSARWLAAPTSSAILSGGCLEPDGFPVVADGADGILRTRMHPDDPVPALCPTMADRRALHCKVRVRRQDIELAKARGPDARFGASRANFRGGDFLIGDHQRIERAHSEKRSCNAPVNYWAG